MRRAIVMGVKRDLGFEPTDRELERLGYDIESKKPNKGTLRLLEVKGRASGEAVLIITKTRYFIRSTCPMTLFWGWLNLKAMARIKSIIRAALFSVSRILA